MKLWNVRIFLHCLLVIHKTKWIFFQNSKFEQYCCEAHFDDQIFRKCRILRDEQTSGDFCIFECPSEEEKSDGKKTENQQQKQQPEPIFTAHRENVQSF